MTDHCLVAIDLGTQSLRVSVLDVEGVHLWSWQRPVATSGGGERQEQDPAEWRELLLDGLAAASATGLVPEAIRQRSARGMDSSRRR